MDNEKTKPAGRRSERAKKRKESYSPELKSQRKVLKTNTKTKPPSRTNPNRLFDLMPNGEPFCCHMCKSPYVACPVNKPGKRKERSRHAPLPNTRVDQNTGREMVLCNACAQTYDHPRTRVKKVVSLPTEEEQKTYTTEATLFTKALRQHYDDSRVEKLFCPVSKKKLCGCLQKYIKMKGSTGEDSPVPQLLSLMKEAETLRREKVYTLNTTNTKHKKFIGLGNGHKKSKQYEAFVLVKRQYLKDTMQLCERAIQRILIYSNNFLHKRLKTENRPCRIERTRGKAVLGKLPELISMVDLVCCHKNCVAMAWTHRKLLQEWRDRAQQGQMEARRVLAEMLTPTGASNCNCYQFISMVTGCSLTTIGRVFNQMLDTNGDREPPEHGMKRVWQENYKKTRVTTVETNTTQAAPNQTPVVVATRQTVDSEEMSSNPIAPGPSHLEQEQQKLALIQQELSEKQQQLQQQENNLHLLAQHVSSTSNWQNTPLVQQLFKQLVSQGNIPPAPPEDMTVVQPIASKGAYTQPQSNCEPVRNEFQIAQQKTVHLVNTSCSTWPRQDTPHMIDNQSTVQLQPAIRPLQHILINQSSFPPVIQQPLTLDNIQLAASATQAHIQPALFQQANVIQEPGNTFSTVIPQPAHILSPGQISTHRPALNIQNIIIDSSHTLPLIQHDSTGNLNVEQAPTSGFFQLEREHDNQSMQIQLVSNPAGIKVQPTVNMVDSSQVKLPDISCRPVMINSDVIQQMLHNGTLQILPEIGTDNAVRLNITHQENKAETLEQIKQPDVTTQTELQTVPTDGQDQPIVSTPTDTRCETNNLTSLHPTGQLPQLIQTINIPATSVATGVTLDAGLTENSVCDGNNYNQMAHSNNDVLVPSESNFQIPIGCSDTLLASVAPAGSAGATEATSVSEASRDAYMSAQTPIEYRPILPCKTNEADRTDHVQTEQPSQIQISFETVIDQTGQTATSHIMLPHSNVLTLPIVPLCTTTQAQPSDPPPVNSLAKPDIHHKPTLHAHSGNNSKSNTKTKHTRKRATKERQKESHVGKTKVKYKSQPQSFDDSSGSNIGPTHTTKLENTSLPDTDLTSNVKTDSACETVDGHTLRQEEDSSTDKSRHSSGNSIRSRQSSGNSECLKQTLLIDSLRPLSGMSDILERSRQYSGSSQINMRSRTSSGNSFLTEHLHGSLLSNLSPNAFLNKDRGVFFLSSENELSEMCSIPISDPVNPIPDFILSDDHVTDLPSQTELESIPESQLQTHSQTDTLYCSVKDKDMDENTVNQSAEQTYYYQPAAGNKEGYQNPPCSQQQTGSNVLYTVEYGNTRKTNTSLKTLVDKSPVLNSLLLKPPKHKPWSNNKDGSNS